MIVEAKRATHTSTKEAKRATHTSTSSDVDPSIATMISNPRDVVVCPVGGREKWVAPFGTLTVEPPPRARVWVGAGTIAMLVLRFRCPRVNDERDGPAPIHR